MNIRTCFALIVLCLCPTASTWAQHLGEISHRRAVVILNKCMQRPAGRCSEDDIEQVVWRYSYGDRSLLRPLLDLWRISDGSLSELLGMFYADLLEHQPEAFLRAIQHRPKKQQQELASAAASGDGSGLSPNLLKKIRQNLARLGNRKDSLAAIARLCLAQVNKTNTAQ